VVPPLVFAANSLAGAAAAGGLMWDWKMARPRRAAFIVLGGIAGTGLHLGVGVLGPAVRARIAAFFNRSAGSGESGRSGEAGRGGGAPLK